MAIKSGEADVVFTASGKWIAWAHTVIAYCAFLGALITGVYLHYHKIVQNEYYGYPEEWFPSVSATIGDRYPERSVFQVFIAMTSGPRFALVFLFYILTARPAAALPRFVLGIGILRTLTCGGWTYVTSTDDHGWHDIFMISYLVATLPWTLGCIALTGASQSAALKWRKRLAAAFFATLVPLIYYFIQHKVHRVPGAYTIYAFFEWALILLDVGFDAVTALEFQDLELVVRDRAGVSRGDGQMIKDKIVQSSSSSAIAQTLDSGFSLGKVLDAAADVYNGFVFWSVLTSLGVTVWYFPLWHMGISGYEVAVMCTITPFLLCSSSIRALLTQKVRYLYLVSLLGLLAYLVRTPELRLLCVTVGVSSTCLAWTTTWYGERSSASRLNTRVLGWSIGLIASSVAKFANYSNNPVWPIMHSENGGWNKTGVILAIIAAVRATSRVQESRGGFQYSTSQSRSPIIAGCGLGGLLFGLHSLLSDSSTMIMWVWEGHPVRGPIAAIGVLTLLSMGAGLLIASLRIRSVGRWTHFALLALGALLVTTCKHWTGYTGAAVLAFELMFFSSVLIKSGVHHGPASFGLAFFIYNLLVLAHVWVVAYAFVPGGPLLREHTDWIMMAMVVLIGAGVAVVPVDPLESEPYLQPASRRQKGTESDRAGFPYLSILAFLELLAVSVAYLRFPTNDYTPYHANDKVLTAGIWTVHFSLDNDMWSSERRMRDLIKEMEVDVIGLLETDLQRIIMGNRDTTQYLAEDLGMYVDAGPGPNKHTWGAALLSKFPIVNSTHHLLPSPVGELAPAIHATLDAYDQLVDVVVFHSGQEEDPEDRRLQSEYLAKLMHESPRPLILLSYLVVKPQEGNYHTYVGEKSGMRDIDATDWDRWCEYILYKGIKRAGYARVSRSTITDTELQVGKFIVGAAEGGDTRITEDQVAPGLRFPAMFRGEGKRGHAYHVFDEPRYYA